jgi:flagellar motor switch protein FliN/FliY
LGKDEIEALLSGVAIQGGRSGEPSARHAPPGSTSAASHPGADIEALLHQGPSPGAVSKPVMSGNEGQIARGDVELLLNQAERALASLDAPAEPVAGAAAVPYELREFSGSPPSTEHATLDLIQDVDLDLRIELGRTQMYLEDVLKLRKGSVVTLDKLAGDPVDIYVNGRLIARGEVLVLNDNFCIRVAELVAGETVKG